MRFSTIFGVFLFLISFSSWSQETCKCSLLNIENEISTLNKRDSLAVFRLVNTLKKATDFGCKLQGISIELEYYCIQKEYKKAVSLITFLENLEKKNSCNSEFGYFLFFNKAIYYRAINNYEKLSEFAFKSLKEAEYLKDQIKVIEAIKQIVYLFTRMDEDEKNWAYVKRAQKLILNQKESIKKVINYRWLAYEYENKYTTTGRKTLLDSGFTFTKKATIGAFQHKNYDELAKLYRAFESFSYHKGEVNKALQYIDTAIFFAKQIKGEKNLSGLYLSKAWDHLDLGEKEEAIQWMDSVIYHNKTNDVVGIMMEHLDASDLYEQAGRLDKAYAAFKVYAKMKDSIIHKERVEVINELEKKYKTELKDAQIKRQSVWLVIAIFCIVMLLFLGTIFQLKKTKQKNQVLKEAFEKQLILEKELTGVRDHIVRFSR